MNILYCGDENITKGVTLSVLSLLKNVKEDLSIYILTVNTENIKGVKNLDVKKLDNKVKEKNKKSFVKKIDVTSIFENNLPEKNMNTRFTPCCMLRLYVGKIEEIPNKILYLDTDVLCRRDCTEFYNQNIDEYELVGSLDYYGKWFFRNNLFKMDYLNSGVLLLNLDKIKETKLFDKCIDMCKNKEMFMPDQSAINKLAKYKKIEPAKYNEQRKLKKDTVFQHFTTTFKYFPWIRTYTVKPWEIDRVHNELKIFDYDDIFEEYERMEKDDYTNISNN